MEEIENKGIKLEKPLVSIIVITYNSSRYVLETLESAKAQTYKNIELIITDDCSTDDTVEVCKVWLKENDLDFVRTKLITVEKNTGIPSNCNRGINGVKGEWIKIIAGDDSLKKNAIQLYLDYISLNPDTKFLHAKMQVYEDEILIENEVSYYNYENYLFNQKSITPQKQFQILLRINPLCTPTSFIKRNLFLKYGHFNENFRLWEDRPMWLNLTKNGVQLLYLNAITVNYRKSVNSIQSKKNNLKIFSEFEILIDGYMMNFSKHFGVFEKTIRMLDYKRKFYLDKIGLNKIAFFPRVINFISGYFIVRYIKYVNNKYTL